MDTLNTLIDTSVERFGDRPAVSQAFEPPLSYADFHARIVKLATLLSAEGIKKGDRVAVMAENSCNWGIAYLGTVRLGAVVVPILPDLPESDVHHILLEAKIKFLFTTQRQLDKVYELQDHHLARVVTLDDSQVDTELLQVEPFSDFLARVSSTPPLPREAEAVTPDDIASIIYTSGTSGHSKAVELRHRNFFANVESTNVLIDIQPGWVFLSVLPMSHAYEFTIGFLLPLYKGANIVYAGKSPTPAVLQKLCQVAKPSVMCAVPMIMEKIYKKRVKPVVEKKRLLSLAVKLPALRKLVYRKIGNKLLAFFGGRLELMAIGGAALNPEVERFMVDAGFPYIVGYGLTESAPLLAGGPFGDPTIAVGSTGKPVPGVTIRIRQPHPVTGIGEITAQGPNIMQGYFNNPEETAAVLDRNGWLATGDLGYLDEHNNLFIKGRSKNVIVMANGENVYPEAVEHKINAFSPVVESLVLENNTSLEAWIYPDYELIDAETKDQSDQQKRLYIETLLKALRDEVNDQLPSAARISRCIERREPFIKTATQKIKRYLYQESNPDM